ncbi:MAG TPA: glycosyltransferase family 39 protein [Solirubrobacteraceae bacterium]|jgi:4-amino-4-deoxy-L-arabinose transferase-like glycosyltransferase
MNATSETSTSALSQAGRSRSPQAAALSRPRTVASAIERLALVAILALSAAMNTVKLAQNGYANNFYSAGVKSMLRSLHNFLYVSSDPGGLITIDKPPLSLWLQVASAKIFGFAPLSLLLPEAIAGVICVLVLYLALAKPLGRGAALMAALSLAVFPAFVASCRTNDPDALLILLMCLACWLALRAIGSGRLLTLLASAVAIGLAFNTKTLAAYLVVPGIALAYALCAPEPLLRRVLKLLAAGVLLAVISVAWMAYVDLTPAAHRPYVGSTTDNSELGLAFEYNGFGRLDGQTGGPNEIPNRPGASVPLEGKTTAKGPPGSGAEAQPATILNLAPFTPSFVEVKPVPPIPSSLLPDGRDRNPTPFAKSPGPLRLLKKGLNTEAGWLVPLALLGLVALALWILDCWRHGEGDARVQAPAKGAQSSAQSTQASTQDASRRAGWESRRRDPRLAALFVFGGWFLVEAVFLSAAKGIVHPYYSSALAPGAAAMVGGGLTGFAALMRRKRGWAALFALAVLLTAIAQVTIFDGNHYMRWFGPVLIAVTAVLALIAIGTRARSVTVWATLGVLLIAPTIYASATWGTPVNGTFPVAGPRGAPGYGHYNVKPEELRSYRKLLAYLAHRHLGSRFSVLTVSSTVSSPLILMGSDAASLAGYSGTDPAVSSGRLAHMVAEGEARYVLLGGPYSNRGGNSATKATLAVCQMVPASAWGDRRLTPVDFALFDCAGRAQALFDWHPS